MIRFIQSKSIFKNPKYSWDTKYTQLPILLTAASEPLRQEHTTAIQLRISHPHHLHSTSRGLFTFSHERRCNPSPFDRPSCIAQKLIVPAIRVAVGISAQYSRPRTGTRRLFSNRLSNRKEKRGVATGAAHF